MINTQLKKHLRLRQLNSWLRVAVTFLLLVMSVAALARYGGGSGSGSSGGGGSSSGSWSSYNYGGKSSSDSDVIGLVVFAFLILLTLPIWMFKLLLGIQRIRTILILPMVSIFNPKWRGLRRLVKQIFFECQKAWMHDDQESIKGLLEDGHFSSMQSVLRSQIGNDRLNILEDIRIHRVKFQILNIRKKEFLVTITASMKDYMVCKLTKKPLAESDIVLRPRFTEFWQFTYNADYRRWQVS